MAEKEEKNVAQKKQETKKSVTKETTPKKETVKNQEKKTTVTKKETPKKNTTKKQETPKAIAKGQESKKEVTKKKETKQEVEKQDNKKAEGYKVVGKATMAKIDKPETKVAGKVIIEEKAQKQIDKAKSEPKVENKQDNKTNNIQNSNINKNTKSTNKTNNFVIPVILIIAVVVIILVATFGSKISNKIKLDKEISNVFNGTATEEIKTTGDYAVIEEAIKKYHKLFLSVQQEFMSKIEDEKIQNMLTPSNYTADGPDFIESKSYIEKAKEEFNKSADDLVNLINEQAVMSQIEDKNLSDYYINIYRSYFYDGENLTEVYESVYKEIDDTKKIMNSLYDNEIKILDFLSENKDHWKIDNSKITFDSSSVSAQYNSLLVQLNAQ